MTNDNTESSNNSVSDDVDESETGYSTGTGSSEEEEESATNSSRRTTTEADEEEDETETTVDEIEEFIPPQVSASVPPIQPIKVTTIARTEDVAVSTKQSIGLDANCDQQESPTSEKSSLALEPPPISQIENRSADFYSGNDNGLNKETSNRSKKWFLPFSASRRSQQSSDSHSDRAMIASEIPGKIPEYTDPARTSSASKTGSGWNEASPSRTATFSDSGTPDRVGNLPPVDKSTTTFRDPETGTVMPNDDVALAADPSVVSSISIRCMVILVLAALMAVGLSTIGTSYLGAELALRGFQVSSDNSGSIVDPPLNNTTNAPIQNDNNTISPSDMRPCSSGNVLFSFEIVFDSKPAEVGISLKDQSDIAATNSGIWLFQALSFRSFSQFQRKNIFSVCLSNTSVYEFEITDTSGNGLVSTFGASTQVYGRWTIRLDSLVVANYFGDCNATTAATDANSITSIVECGEYCRCLFNVSKTAKASGGCTTICT